uniref:Uncharacterized protein n=1 Tax=Cannabis sativa TaxID=3483 RepID=A0A803QRU6_CANSA
PSLSLGWVQDLGPSGVLIQSGSRQCMQAEFDPDLGLRLVRVGFSSELGSQSGLLLFLRVGPSRVPDLNHKLLVCSRPSDRIRVKMDQRHGSGVWFLLGVRSPS